MQRINGRDGAEELLVVLNPRSRSGDGVRVRPEIERELERRGIRFRIEQTRGRAHALELAASAALAGARVVVAAGGDGTIHDVANGILDADCAAQTVLGIIPIGRGNDLVKVIPGTTPRTLAYDTLAAGAVRAIDVGRVEWAGGGEWFLNAMGTGIDVEVVRQIERTPRLPAALVYVVGLAKALVRYRPIPLRITVDGRRLERRVMIIAVANGACIGGSFRVAPAARPDDGVLDVCIVDEVGLARAARIGRHIMRGTHVGQPEVTMLSSRETVIETSGVAPLFVQLDGELREPGTRSLRVFVRPGALRVLASPAGAAAASPPPTHGVRSSRARLS